MTTAKRRAEKREASRAKYAAEAAARAVDLEEEMATITNIIELSDDGEFTAGQKASLAIMFYRIRHAQ